MNKVKWDSPPEMQIDTSKTYMVEIETNQGVIELELYPEHAPKTVNNFVFLAREDVCPLSKPSYFRRR